MRSPDRGEADMHMKRWNPRERKEKLEGFRCAHCREWVPVNDLIGTANRNHCPSCLWSKHVDLIKPGDRKAECRAGMEPIGLTFKQEGLDKWGQERQGELMLIHRCSQDDKISINRVAADDNPEKILDIFRDSQSMDQETRAELSNSEINLLTEQDLEEIRRQLYGSH